MRKAAWAVPAVLVAGLCLVLLLPRRGEVAAPGNFPVLDPDEIGAGAGPPGGSEEATFGAGCFWCTEAVYRQLKGVTGAACGYSGGHVENPTYKQVCTGTTGHAEVVRVTFDPAVVSYAELLEVFWRSHDPTTPDRQGHDVGPQYRSVVIYHSDRQRRLAERYRERIDAAGVFPSPVVTEVVPFVAFYSAEADHQDFFARNPRQPYCRAVIGPKLDKLRAAFGDRLRAD